MPDVATIKYIVIIPIDDDEQEIKIMDTLDELKELEFDDQEKAKKVRILETEFKRKITFKTKISLDL